MNHRCNQLQSHLTSPTHLKPTSLFSSTEHSKQEETNIETLNYNTIHIAHDSTTALGESQQLISNPSQRIQRLLTLIGPFVRKSFIPSGKMSADYYSYTMWRMMQRLVSATSNVFGTQALLLALGFKSNSIGTLPYILYFILIFFMFMVIQKQI